MTLLIAGHTFKKTENFNWDLDDLSASEPEENSATWEDQASGIFFLADSAISRNGKTLLNEFKKIYQIYLNVYKPNIRVKNFNGYEEIQYTSPVTIAFAGNTLTAQHVLNQIESHLSYLQATFDEKGAFKVALPCERNFLKETSIEFDPYNPTDFSAANSEIDANFIAGVIEHSFDLAVRSARKYKVDEEAYKQLFAEFIAGIRCPKHRTYHLYSFYVGEEYLDGRKFPIAKKEEILPGVVVVGGLKRECTADCQNIYDQEKAAMREPEKKLFEYLKDKIRAKNVEMDFSIAEPATMKIFSEKGLRTVVTTQVPDQHWHEDREKTRKNLHK